VKVQMRIASCSLVHFSGPLGSASVVIPNSAQGKSRRLVWGGAFDELVHKPVKKSTAQIR